VIRGSTRPAWAARLGTPARVRVAGVFVFSLTVFALWWAAFYPGLLTYDSRQQWEQAQAWVFVDWHPAFHTWLIALLTRVWYSPAAITSLHVLALAAVLASLTRRLERFSVRPTWAVLGPCFVAAWPSTGPLLPIVWKDIPFAISVLWLFAEVLDLVADPNRYLDRWTRPARLAIAAILVLGFRHNGIFVVGLVLAAVLVTHLRHWRRLLLVCAVVLAGNVGIKQGLYAYLDVYEAPVLFSYTTLMHDMAAFVDDHWDDMSADDQAFLASILPYEEWVDAYVCQQATGLIVNDHFTDPAIVDHTGQPPVLADNPQSPFLEAHRGEFRSMWFRFVRRWPHTFYDHHIGCVGSLAWLPWHRTGVEVLEPPVTTVNDIPGVTLEPLNDDLHDALVDVRTWWGKNGVAGDPWHERWRRVITWRAVVWCYAGLAAVALAAWRRRRWNVLAIGAPGLASQLSVLVATPGQSFRYMFPAYLCALASLALFSGPRRTRGEEAADADGTDVDEGVALPDAGGDEGPGEGARDALDDERPVDDAGEPTPAPVVDVAGGVAEGPEVLATSNVRDAPPRLVGHGEHDGATGDAGDLGEGGTGDGHVLEDLDREDEVEDAVGERERRTVGEEGGEPSRTPTGRE
jgi:hypothetical protein